MVRVVGTDAGDQVLELVEYPELDVPRAQRTITEPGLTHVGLLCNDIEATRGVIFILVEKTRPERPYWRQ